MNTPEYRVLQRHHNSSKPVLDDLKSIANFYRRKNYSVLMATSVR